MVRTPFPNFNPLEIDVGGFILAVAFENLLHIRRDTYVNKGSHLAVF